MPGTEPERDRTAEELRAAAPKRMQVDLVLTWAAVLIVVFIILVFVFASR